MGLGHGRGLLIHHVFQACFPLGFLCFRCGHHFCVFCVHLGQNLQADLLVPVSPVDVNAPPDEACHQGDDQDPDQPVVAKIEPRIPEAHIGFDLPLPFKVFVHVTSP